MSDEMVKAEDIGITLAKDDEFDFLTEGAWLPRLQFCAPNSDVVKEDKIPKNHYAKILGKHLTDLGESIDIIPLERRRKAMDMSGDQMLIVYDPKLVIDEATGKKKATGEFARIMEKSTETNSGCMFGPEFLVYVPQLQEFLTFFMGSASARNESALLTARLLKPTTLKSQALSNTKYKWTTPAVFECSTPFDLPNVEEVKAQIIRFNNPPESTVETVDKEEEVATARAR